MQMACKKHADQLPWPGAPPTALSTPGLCEKARWEGKEWPWGARAALSPALGFAGSVPACPGDLGGLPNPATLLGELLAVKWGTRLPGPGGPGAKRVSGQRGVPAPRGAAGGRAGADINWGAVKESGWGSRGVASWGGTEPDEGPCSLFGGEKGPGSSERTKTFVAALRGRCGAGAGGEWPAGTAGWALWAPERSWSFILLYPPVLGGF